jgi:hypothetical protein
MLGAFLFGCTWPQPFFSVLPLPLCSRVHRDLIPMTTFVLPMASVGAPAIVAILQNEYVSLSKQPTKAANGAALVSMAVVLLALLQATEKARVIQIMLRAAYHSVLSRAGEDVSRGRVDLLVMATKTALSHVRRLALNEGKLRQCCRWLSLPERETVEQLCRAAGGTRLPPKNTLITVWAGGRDGSGAKKRQAPESTEEDAFSTGYDLTKFAQAASLPGGLKALASRAEKRKEPAEAECAKKPKHEDIAPASESAALVPLDAAAEAQPPTTVPTEVEEPLTTPQKESGGRGHRPAKFASPSLGRVSLSLGQLRSEICFVETGSSTKKHLVTFHGVQSHRQLAASIVELACSSDATAAELREVGRQKLQELRELERGSV